ncbi:Uncharacterized protein NEOC65_000792 [Neochlamydia sp. AcF65]|nr:Uncharacterized protein [Neochlamydia sp. AcF65]
MRGAFAMSELISEQEGLLQKDYAIYRRPNSHTRIRGIAINTLLHIIPSLAIVQ